MHGHRRNRCYGRKKAPKLNGKEIKAIEDPKIKRIHERKGNRYDNNLLIPCGCKIRLLDDVIEPRNTRYR